jgi:predicted transcriptional regulator YheO
MATDVDSEVKHKILRSLQTVMKAIVELLGPSCEVVLHDVSDPAPTIVAVGGDVRGRCAGDPLADSCLKCRPSPDPARVYRRTTIDKEGRVIKSASVLVSDDQGEVCGGLCINLDITAYVEFHHHLQALVRTTSRETSVC